jgi:hypothetical protein
MTHPTQLGSLSEGDDVMVVFPSGRQVVGRVEELVMWHDKLANIIVWVDDYSDSRIYPPGWVHAWEDAPEDTNAPGWITLDAATYRGGGLMGKRRV